MIYNRTNRLLKVVDGEDSSRHLDVEPNEEESFNGTILPWAANDAEVTGKSFHFLYYSPSKGKWLGWFHVFQNYSNDHAAWVDWNSASPHGDAMQADFRSSYVDIQVTLDSDGEPVVEFVKV
ncbi:hypothetical protein [Streptomyces avermitilis]|uniref:hypothetical protein n=1 Tax=Streptomyces avermitilis TaxID=33903 RepID=UPI0033B8E94E